MQWYDEIKDYDFSSGKSKGGDVGHFANMMNPGRKKIGCGWTSSNSGVSKTSTWCNYVGGDNGALIPAAK